MEFEDDVKVDLKKYKGHFRKFPWALIVRAIVALISIWIIFMLVKSVEERKSVSEKATEETDTEIEIEIQP